MRRIGVALAISVVGRAGCGGGGSSTVSDQEIAKATSAVTTITDYCVAQIQTQTGQGPGGDLGQAAQAVDDLIAIYRKHPDAKFGLTPAAPQRTTKQWLCFAQSQLGTGNCSPQQAAKIDEALR